jgi:hypothetical protein
VPPKQSKPFPIVLALVVAVVAWALYMPTLDAGWTDTDDIQLITEDAHFLVHGRVLPEAFTRSFFPAAGSSKHYYRPLVTASFMFDARRSDPVSPAPFHGTNSALHAISALLVFAIAAHLTESSGLAALVALLFAVHPAAVQTVAWVPGRSDGLMATFALASLLAWIRYDRNNSRLALITHLAGLAFALLSKEAAVALIPIVLSYSWLVTQRKERLRNPMIGLGWAVIVGGWWALRSGQVSGVGNAVSLPVLLQNTPTLVAGLGKLFMAVELHTLATLHDTTWWPGWFVLAVVAGVGVWLPSARRRTFFWAALIVPFFVLAPTLAVSDVLILDNRLYLAVLGLALGLLVPAEVLLNRWPAWRPHLAGALAMLLVLLGADTVRYARAFSSPKTFCLAAVEGSPHLALAHVNLGSTLYREGDISAAEQQFSQVVAIDPRWPVAHNNLGLIYLNQGRLKEAQKEFETELAVNPDYPKSHFNLGLVLARTGREEQAAAHFERVVQLVPSDIGAWGELLKYWGPRDARRATQIMEKMEQLGVRFHSPGGS